MAAHRGPARFGRVALLVVLGVAFLWPGVLSANARAAPSGLAVNVGVYENSPKVFTSEPGVPSGIFIDIIESIAEREGWTLHYVPTMTFQQVPAQDHVGDVVCHAGSSTMEAVGYSICGTLMDRDLDYTTLEDGYRHLNFRKSNVNARSGDSGGAVFNGHSALGIVTSGDGCNPSLICTDMIYSHIYYAVAMPSGTYGVQLTP